MSTTIRPVISNRNKYWIDKHRYYELKHFCLQYPVWIQARDHLDSLSKSPTYLEKVTNSNIGNPTEKCVEEREYYSNRIELVRKAAAETDEYLARYILLAVTENYSYNFLYTKLDVPCSKDTYYNLYRKFFWILSKLRE